MEKYSISYIFPPDNWFMAAILFLVGIYFWFIGLRFLSNIKSGVTLLYLGAQPILIFKLIPGLLKREDANQKFNVYGYAYVSSTKCIMFGVFFWLVALLMVLSNFISIKDLGR